MSGKYMKSKNHSKNRDEAHWSLSPQNKRVKEMYIAQNFTRVGLDSPIKVRMPGDKQLESQKDKFDNFFISLRNNHKLVKAYTSKRIKNDSRQDNRPNLQLKTIETPKSSRNFRVRSKSPDSKFKKKASKIETDRERRRRDERMSPLSSKLQFKDFSSYLKEKETRQLIRVLDSQVRVVHRLKRPGNRVDGIDRCNSLTSTSMAIRRRGVGLNILKGYNSGRRGVLIRK